LATITFTVDALGASSLYLVDTKLTDYPLGQPIAHTVEDGHFVNSPVHDIAITSVTPNATAVILGKTVTVNVTARNHGNCTESFTVAAYRNATAIGAPQAVTNLAPGGRTTLTFTWDTTGAALGKYIISGNATTVSGETDTTDNTLDKTYDYNKKIFVDVTITIIDYPVAVFTPSPTKPVVGETVTFNASDSDPRGGKINYYYWEFGDGSLALSIALPHVFYAYNHSGTFNVTLLIKDNEGLNATTWQLVTVTFASDIASPKRLVDVYDLALMGKNYGWTGYPNDNIADTTGPDRTPRALGGDLWLPDGKVDNVDLVLMGKEYGSSLPS